MLSAIFSRNQPCESQARGSEYQPLVEEAETEPAESTEPTESTELVMRQEIRAGDIASEWAAYISGAAFLVSTWLITLNSGVPAPFIWHPIMQSMGIALFAYGS